MFIADTFNCRIRKVTVSTGIISTVAGTGTSSYSGDLGLATSAGLSVPYGVAIDSSGTTHIFIFTVFFFLITIIIIHSIGNIYIADYSNNRIRKVTVSTGIISTIAGTGTASYSGDGSKATSAALYQPSGAAIDSAGKKKYIFFCH